MGASDFSKLPHIGESVRRKEDYRFLTGAGQYTDDITMAHQSYAVFVRSPHAHAIIKSISTGRAKSMPGVIEVFIGKDLEGKMGGLPCGWLINNPDGSPMKEPPHPVLALGKARHVGDQVAMVIAETLEQAKKRRRGGRGGLRSAQRGHRCPRRRQGCRAARGGPGQPLFQMGAG